MIQAQRLPVCADKLGMVVCGKNRPKKNLPEGRFEKFRDLDQSMENLICLPSLTERV